MKKIRTRIILPLLILLILLPAGGDIPFRTPGFNNIARPYAFSMINWSVSNLSSDLVSRIRYHNHYTGMAEDKKLELVRTYLYLCEEHSYLDYRMTRLENATGNVAQTERETTATRLSEVITTLDTNAIGTQIIISEKINDVLEEEDISLLPGLTFPPVIFSFAELPYLLVISPRARIEMEDTLVLHSGLTSAEITDIEKRLTDLGYSALVERVGGISTYPSMIPNNASAEFILATIAHEWTHHYLFFHSLGRNYYDSYEMRTINETVADIVGDEIGAQLITALYGNNNDSASNAPQGKDTFDFNNEMHNIRVTTDSLLAEGKIKEAEEYMETQRQYLEQNGYYVRKINQAYFAWHGSYGTSPGSVSPVGTQLQTLRAQCNSLKEFLDRVSSISNPDDLTELIG